MSKRRRTRAQIAIAKAERLVATLQRESAAFDRELETLNRDVTSLKRLLAFIVASKRLPADWVADATRYRH